MSPNMWQQPSFTGENFITVRAGKDFPENAAIFSSRLLRIVLHRVQETRMPKMKVLIKIIWYANKNPKIQHTIYMLSENAQKYVDVYSSFGLFNLSSMHRTGISITLNK